MNDEFYDMSAWLYKKCFILNFKYKVLDDCNIQVFYYLFNNKNEKLSTIKFIVNENGYCFDIVTSMKFKIDENNYVDFMLDLYLLIK